MTTPLKCPCCGKAAERLSYRNVEAQGPDGEVVMTLIIACPSCNLVMGASVNPAEYVAAMLRHLRATPEEPQRSRLVEAGGR
jgi:hypothetical protein